LGKSGEGDENYDLIWNQIATTTAISTIAAQTAGATFLLLPLRGERLGAWL
jgi:hypothetical protein